jgi:predicted transposase YdaD
MVCKTRPYSTWYYETSYPKNPERREIPAMFELSDLKKTRVYQDAFAEGKAEAQAEAKQREKVVMLRMLNLGIATEDIATSFDLPIAEVTAIIAQAQLQEQFKAQLQAQFQAQIKQREKAAILRMFNVGLITEQIALFLDLPIAEVAEIVTQSQQEQAEQN